jgi:hypothetical protein
MPTFSDRELFFVTNVDKARGLKSHEPSTVFLGISKIIFQNRQFLRSAYSAAVVANSTFTDGLIVEETVIPRR